MTTPLPNQTLILQPGKQTTLQIQPGQHIKIRKGSQASDLPPDNLIATRQGDTLHVRYADGSTVDFKGFFRNCSDANVCSVNLAGNTEAGTTLSADMASGNVAVTGPDGGTLVYAHGSQDSLYAMAQNQSALQSALGNLGDTPVLTYLPGASTGAGAGGAAAGSSAAGFSAGGLAGALGGVGLAAAVSAPHDSGPSAVIPVTVSSMAITSATGIQSNILNEGDVVQVTVTVTMSEATTVTGSPTLALNIGGTVVQASYDSGSGSAALIFKYTIQAGQTDTDGISITAADLALGGGTLRNAVGNDAVLSHAAVTDNLLYKVDTTAPALPVINVVAGNDVINAMEAASTVSGTNEAGARVKLTIGGVVRTATVSGTTWSYALQPADITNLGQGSSSWSVTQTDAAGNTSAAATRTVTVDTVAPTITISPISGGTLTRPEYDALATTPLQISGTTTGVENGQQVSIVLNNKTYAATVTGNAWSFNVPTADAQALNHGNTYAATVGVSDLAGNSSNMGSANLVINIAPPDIPTIIQQTTNTTTPVITGHAEKTLDSGVTFLKLAAGDIVSISIDGGAAYTLTVGGTSSPAGLTYDTVTGDWQLDLNGGTALTSGTHEVAVTVTAAAVVKTDISSHEIIVNTAATTVSINAVAGDNVVNATEAATTVVISGTTTNVEAGRLVTVTLADNTTQTAQVLMDGSWSLSVAGSTFGANGSHTVKADVSNDAGTAAIQASRNVSVDKTAPTMAIASDLSNLIAGQTANITFSFSEDPGTSFAINDIVTTGGSLGALSGTGLTRTATFTPTPGLASGNASITVAAGSYTDAAGNAGGAGGTPAIAIDTLAPTVAITSSASALKAGETATITFTFSEAPGASFTASDITTTGGTLGALSGSGLTRTATFTPTANLASGNASITVAAGSYTDTAGNPGGAGTTPAIAIDTLAPTLTITSSASALRAGQTAAITFSFSEAPGSSFTDSDIVVTGGTLSAIAGTGLTRTATFTPTPGLTSGNASITVAAGSYTDPAGNPGGAGTTPAISMDTLVPTVSSMAITSATGIQSSTLNAGDVVQVTLTMSEATTVTGTPNLGLTIGGSVVQASYVSGSGTTALVFSYTILAGQTDANGISIAANSLSLNGGTLKDAAGNSATLTHSAVADNASYLVDTTAPSVAITSSASAVKAGETATITFTFSEDPSTSFTASDITTTGGTLGALSGSGLTRTATFTPTANLASGNASITVAAGSYTDTAGNLGGAGTTPAISINTLAPTLAISSSASALKAGEIATITFTFSADPGTSFIASDITTTGGTLGALAGTGLTRTANFTPTANLASGNASITVAAGNYTDTAGNPGGAGTTPAISIDTLVPTVSSVAITGATGVVADTLGTDSVVSVTVNMSEATVVTGTPTLGLTVGGSVVQANYVSGSGTNALVFNYTILSGQADTNGISIAANSLALGGGTLKDAAGNNATLTHSALTDNASYLVNAQLASPIVTLAFDTGSSNSDRVTNNAALVFGGVSGLVAGAAGSYFYLTGHTMYPSDNGNSGVIPVQTSDLNWATYDGNWVSPLTLPATSTDGVRFHIQLGSTNGVGVSAINTNLTSELYVPTRTTADYVYSAAQGKWIFEGAVGYLGVQYSVDGGAYSPYYLAPTTDGSHTVRVTQTDAYGHVSNPYVYTFTLSSAATGTASVVPTQIATIDTYTDNVGTGSGIGNFVTRTSTDDTTPVLNGALTSALLAGETLQIYDGATYLGNATVTGTAWTYATPTLADGTTHNYTARVVNSAGNVGGMDYRSNLILYESSSYERLANASITGSATGWSFALTTTSPVDVSYYLNAVDFNANGQPAGGSAYQTVTNLIVGQSYTVQYELGELTNAGTHTMLAKVVDGAVWNAGTQLASQTYTQTTLATTLHSFTFTATSSTATLVFTNTSSPITANTDVTLEQASIMTTDEAARHAATPLVLDLNGDGVQTVALAQGVVFDVANTGTANQTAWVSKADGLLVRDINHDGLINNGAELFGEGTLLADGSHAANGFAALAQFDANHDGKIDAKDAVFKELLVWRDANGDGVSQAGELLGLQQLGIVSFNLNASTGYAVEHGNLHGLVSSYTTQDGVVHDLTDVWFQQAATATAKVQQVL